MEKLKIASSIAPCPLCVFYEMESHISQQAYGKVSTPLQVFNYRGVALDKCRADILL